MLLRKGDFNGRHLALLLVLLLLCRVPGENGKWWNHWSDIAGINITNAIDIESNGNMVKLANITNSNNVITVVTGNSVENVNNTIDVNQS